MAVCLHCLHSERVAAQGRRQRVLIRVGVGVITLAVVAAAGNAGWRSLRGVSVASGETRFATATRTTPPAPTVATRADSAPASAVTQASSDTAVRPAPVEQPAAPADSIVGSSALGATNTAVTTPTAAAPAPPATVPAPIVPQGRTELRDSMFAVRSGDTIVVHFDASPTRTRRADKFDRIVRQTLGELYGPVADSALAAVAEGTLATPGDLLAELPRRGIHLAVAGGFKISLWPETRPGRDGPLVVAYRAVVGR